MTAPCRSERLRALPGRLRRLTTTKIDYKREFRGLYRPGIAPGLIEVPELQFLMIDGRGDPNTGTEYREAIETLYPVSFTLKFMIKRAPGGVDYTVMPLEGLWWSDDMTDFVTGKRSGWQWTAMIMQPEAVSAEILADAIETAERKRPLPAASRLRLERFQEGLSAQLMYTGPYSQEGPTIAHLHEFIATAGYVPSGKHHEIYLGDPSRSAPEKLRTIIRQPVGSA